MCFIKCRDDERIIAYNKYCTDFFFPFPQKTSVVQKESQAAENESRPKDELLTYNKQVKQVSRFSTIVR